MDNKVRIVTDSTSDIPKKCAEELGIGIVPLHVIKNGVEDFLDGVTLTSDEFFNMLPYCRKITSSQFIEEEVWPVWDEMAPNGETIISIHISSKLSKSYERAKKAAELRPNVTVIDSLTVSMGLGFLVKDAAELAGDGKSADYITRHIEESKSRVRLIAVLDTLEYLKRGGRIGKAQALFGSMLQVKPMIGVKDGEVVPIMNCRGKKEKAIEKMADKFREYGNMARLAVLHAQDYQGALFAQGVLKERFPDLVANIFEIGPVIGVHSGPGLVGFAGELV